VLGLTVLGAALRFATLNIQSIWLDESATLILVHHGFSGMLSHLSSSESTPPLYYVLVWAWTKVFGAGPIGFRSFSALTGTLTIPLLYAAGREITPRVGVWAAALTAVNPAMYYYSQEARCYSLLILFSAASFVLWQRALRMPDKRRLWLWAAVSILAVLTHYFAAFLFVPEAVVLLRRLGWRRVAMPIGAVVLAGIALLPLAISQRTNGKASWIEEASLTSRLGETVKQFLVGLYGPMEIVAGLAAGLLTIGAIILLLRRADRHERAGARDSAIIAVTGLALPLLLALSHALDVFDGRNVIAAWVPCAVLVAIGVGAKRARVAGAMVGAGLCAVSLAVIVATNAIPAYQRDDWRGVAHILATPTSTRVIVGEQFASPPLSIYLGSLTNISGPSVSTHELDFVALRTRRTGGSPEPPVVPTNPPAGFRLSEVHRTETFAISRFVSPKAVVVKTDELRRLIGKSNAEIFTQQ
jgi:4-amino-4-deoxy-L-arabinose transferase-like glycosyltransferase